MYNVSFKDKIAYSDNGNPYKKTNTFTKVFTGIGVVSAGAHGFSHHKAIKTNMKQASKQVRGINTAFSVLVMLIMLGSSFLTGLFIDYCINRPRKKAADS